MGTASLHTATAAHPSSLPQSASFHGASFTAPAGVTTSVCTTVPARSLAVADLTAAMANAIPRFDVTSTAGPIPRRSEARSPAPAG